MSASGDTGEPLRVFGRDRVRALLVQGVRAGLGVAKDPPPPTPDPPPAPLIRPPRPEAVSIFSPSNEAPKIDMPAAGLPATAVDPAKTLQRHCKDNVTTMPTADEVARAIVAAARETGEDPIACASGRVDQRCRHYAMHALAHVFQGIGVESVARMVGVTGKPQVYWSRFFNNVVRPPKGQKGGHIARWWNDAAYDRVIRAIEDGND